MALESETTSKLISSNNANSLKAAIFHTIAFMLSLENNTDKIMISTKRSFLKVLYKICKIKIKHINFRITCSLYLDGPQIAICETASNFVFVLNSSFTTKDEYFTVAIAKPCEAFNKML